MGSPPLKGKGRNLSFSIQLKPLLPEQTKNQCHISVICYSTGFQDKKKKSYFLDLRTAKEAD